LRGGAVPGTVVVVTDSGGMLGAAGFSTEMWPRLRECGWVEEDALLLWSAGAYPASVCQLAERGWSPEQVLEAHRYTCVGFEDLDDAVVLHDAQLPQAAVLDLLSRRVPARPAATCLVQGLLLDDVILLHQVGYPLLAAWQSVREGFTVRQLWELHTAGALPLPVAQCASAGLSVAHVWDLHSAGVSLWSASRCARVGVSAADIITLHRAGVHVEQIVEAGSAGAVPALLAGALSNDRRMVVPARGLVPGVPGDRSR
jgi:hypothetical protein